MPSFDGDNLIITLDSLVTSVEVQDVYEAWKDWMLVSPVNRKYPAAFRSDGGNPLSAIINQGSYFFLNNIEGWRMRPPEENITIFLTGNLAVEDTTLPAFVPTIGAFTAAILGLQPVTQGVTPAMADQLAFTSFQGGAAINQANGNTGTGTVGSDKIGTRRAPSNNTDDLLTIATREGLTTINVVADLTTTLNTDFSTGFNFIGDSPFIQVNLGAGVNVTNCSFENLTVNGAVDGTNLIKECELENITGFSGEIHDCDLDGDIALIGAAHIVDSYSGRAALGYPRLTNCGVHEIIIRNLRGSIGISGMTGGDHSIGVYGGRLVIEADCTGGTIYVRGDPYEITDLAGGLVTLVDQTSSLKVSEIHGQVTRELWYNAAALANGAGYQQAPYKVLNDLIDDAEANGIGRLNVLSDLTLTRDLKNIVLHGVGLPTFDAAGFELTGMEFLHVQYEGTSTGQFIIQECRILAGAGLQGHVELCTFAGDAILTGPVHIINGISDIAGSGYINLDTNGFGYQITNWHRSLGIQNMTAGVSTIEMYGGQLHLDATCTGGTIYVRGSYSLPPINLGTTVVIDQTSSSADVTIEARVTEVWKILGLDIASPMTVTPINRSAGTISQTITGDGETTSTATRDP